MLFSRFCASQHFMWVSPFPSKKTCHNNSFWRPDSFSRPESKVNALKAEKWDMHGKTFVAAGGFVLHKTVDRSRGKRLMQSCWHKFSGQMSATRLSRNIVCPRSGKNLLIGRVFNQTWRLLQREAFCTEKSWHRGAFTQRSPYTNEIYTQKLLHTDTFTHGRFYK